MTDLEALKTEVKKIILKDWTKAEVSKLDEFMEDVIIAAILVNKLPIKKMIKLIDKKIADINNCNDSEKTICQYAIKQLENLKRQVESKQLLIHGVSEREFVHLAKGNYIDKDGSIKKAQLMKDHLGNEYFMVAKDDLYSR